MLKNYLFVALRNIKRNKLVSSINVMGFVLGIVCCLLISQYVIFETSYDTFHEDAKDIYRITWFSSNPQPRTPHPMAQALIHDFPEVRSAVSLSPIWGPGLTKQTFSVWNPENEHRFEEKEVLSADSTFLDVFSFLLISGDPKTVLTHPNGIVITEATARKYFGNEDPMGKTLVFNEDRNQAEVVGVLENIPENSHFHFDILLPYVMLKSLNPNNPYYTWDDFGHYNYIRLTNDADPKALETKLLDWVVQYIDIEEEDMQSIRNSGAGFRLQPITDIHLTSHIRWELEPNGNIYYVYLMSAAALFILIIACVNFMNLSTARSMERAKEIGVRKALGALKNQLTGQFLMEAGVYSLLALPIAIVLLNFILPVFNNIAGMNLEMEDFTNPFTILGLLAGVGLVGLLSGLYPAFYLSAFKPAVMLKGNFKAGSQGAAARKGLVIFQFSISVILIIGSIVIFDQLKFLSDKNLGFNQSQIVVLPLRNNEERAQVETVKNELNRIEGVAYTAASSNIPGSGFNMNEIWWAEQPRHRVAASECAVDYDYFTTLDIPMVEGRGFSRDFATDSINAFVINQTAAEALNLGNPIGKEIVWNADLESGAMRGTVVGVVQDFHFQSLHEPIRPLLFVVYPQAYNHLIVKIKPGQMQRALTAIETSWQQFDRQYPFTFSFLDENMNKLYRSENQMGKVFGIFSIITVLIACSGLFGLTTFTVAQRTKEVGVRKVLGASTSSILQLLSKDFLELIGVALVVGSPVAWYIMNRWLENFSYRVNIAWWTFIMAASLILIVALFTISYQALKAALDNPIKSLRSE